MLGGKRVSFKVGGKKYFFAWVAKALGDKRVVFFVGGKRAGRQKSIFLSWVTKFRREKEYRVWKLLSCKFTHQ